jgi:hypothetical protein
MDQHIVTKHPSKSPVPSGDSYEFLWDKWKHHDELLYNFITSFWNVQAVSFVIIPIAESKHSMYVVIFLLFLSYINIVYFKTNIKLARTIRNTFNPKLVLCLSERKIIDEDLHQYADTWTAENGSHPINLWHTPYPFSKGKLVASSAKFESLILLITVTEFLVACLWFILSF